MLENGKGNEFKGKSIHEIEIEDFSESSDDENCEQDVGNSTSQTDDISETPSLSNENFIPEDTEKANIVETERMLYDEKEHEVKVEGRKNMYISEAQSVKKQPQRNKWPLQEKKLVLNFFENHLRKKIVPKKHECEEYVAQNRGKITISNWVKIKTLVYNSLRLK